MARASHQVDVVRPLYEIIRSINSGDDLVAALEAVTQGVVDVVGFEVAAIRWLTPELDLEVVSVAGDDDAHRQLMGSRVPLSDVAVELEASDSWGSLLFLPAGRLAETTPGWIPEREAVVGTSGLAGVWHAEDALRAPLRSPEGELLGLLSVDLPRDGLRPDDSRRELLEMYADLAGLALGAARRARALEERVRLGAATRAAMISSVSGADLAGVLDASAELTAKALRAGFLWLRILESGDVPRSGAVATVGTIETPPAPPEVVARATADAEQAWRDGRAVLASRRNGVWVRTSSDLLGRPERLEPAGGRIGWVRPDSEVLEPLPGSQSAVMEFLEPHGVEQVLMCPIGSGDECLGYFVTGRMDGDRWAGEEIEAAGQIARHLGQAVLGARLAAHERELIARLESLDRYRHDLVSTVSHELRTPLSSVVGYLELIDDATPDEVKQPVYVEAVQRNLRRMLDLTDELLVLKRLNATDESDGADGADDEPGVPVDLCEVVAEAIEACAERSRLAGVPVVLDIPHDPVVVSGHPAELDRLAINLVDNALKYTLPGGKVSVRVAPRGRQVELVVADTGIGISADDQTRLFAEFFRSTNPVALARPGTGLGLSIVRAIVQRHRGSIRVVSQEGEGSTFTVWLPGPVEHLDV